METSAMCDGEKIWKKLIEFSVDALRFLQLFFTFRNLLVFRIWCHIMFNQIFYVFLNNYYLRFTIELKKSFQLSKIENFILLYLGRDAKEIYLTNHICCQRIKYQMIIELIFQYLLESLVWKVIFCGLESDHHTL